MSTWPERLAGNHPEKSEALEELRSILLRGLRSGLSGRAGADEAFLQDMVQSSLLRILDRLDTFEGRSRFTSWALAIAFRVAFNELRRRDWNHLSLEQLQERRETLPEEADTAAGPDRMAAQHELAQLIRSVIESDLTSRQRDLLFCELNGMPQEEIASQLSTNRNNVYKLFHDARKALKRALEKHGYDRDVLLGNGRAVNEKELAS